MIVYEAFLSGRNLDEWKVEGVDYDHDGQVYVAIFSGPAAMIRAEEYAAFKNRTDEKTSVDNQSKGETA